MKIALIMCMLVMTFSPHLAQAQQYFCQNDEESIQSSGTGSWEKVSLPPGTLKFSVLSSGSTYRDVQALIYIQGDRESLASCEIWSPSKGHGQCSSYEGKIRILLYRSRESGATEFILQAQENGLDRLGLATRIQDDSLVIKGSCQVD